MEDFEQWREEFEALAKVKGLSVARKPHAFVDVDYYVSEQTLWLWSGYLEGRRKADGTISKRNAQREIDQVSMGILMLMIGCIGIGIGIGASL